jgi:hypothetical protein
MLIHMRTSVDISDALHAEAMRVARANHISLRDLMEEGLRSVLERRQKMQQPYELVDFSFGGSGTLPGVDITNWDQVRDVLYEGR